MTTYEFDGEKYQKASNHQKEWGRKLISTMYLKGSEDLLDLGCGDGALTKQIAQLLKTGSVLGIDASAGMIKTAKKHETDRCKFVQMDINELQFNNKFDIIYSNAALHWIQNHKKLLQNCLAALKPHGCIVWNFAGNGTCSHFFSVVRKTMGQETYQMYFQDFKWPWFMPSIMEYKMLAEPIGFSQIEVSEENADRFFSDTEEMIRWLDQPSLVPFLQCVPAVKKEAFRNEVIEAMIKETLQPDGTCFETFRRVTVKAIK